MDLYCDNVIKIGRWGIIKQYEAEYRRIEDRLYRYADIDSQITSVEEEINEKRDNLVHTTSIVLFSWNTSKCGSYLEEFYARSDITRAMEKIQKLNNEKRYMQAVLSRLKPKDYEFVRQEYLSQNGQHIHHYSQRGYYYKKKSVLTRILIITKKCSKLDNG